MDRNQSYYLKYYKTRIQFNSTFLVIEKNNYAAKIVNPYIVYDLDNWPKGLLRNFILQSCLFGVTNIVKNRDKNKFMCSCYGVAFDGED